MDEERRVEFRLRVGIHDAEIEIRGHPNDVETLINRSLEYVRRIRETLSQSTGEAVEESEVEEAAESDIDIIPPLEITSKDSVTSILSKLFSTRWAAKPRSLREVMEALESLGLHYPKSTVAVSLARLVRRNVVRRIKRDNIYLYVPVVPARGALNE